MEVYVGVSILRFSLVWRYLVSSLRSCLLVLYLLFGIFCLYGFCLKECSFVVTYERTCASEDSGFGVDMVVSDMVIK